MPRSGRRRASLVLLLVVAVGLAVAGSTGVAGAHEMACCPAGMESEAPDCAWLGVGDCCTEAPAMPAPSSPAPPAPAAVGGLTPYTVGASPAALPSPGLGLPSPNAGRSTTVLRL